MSGTAGTAGTGPGSASSEGAAAPSAATAGSAHLASSDAEPTGSARQAAPGAEAPGSARQAAPGPEPAGSADHAAIGPQAPAPNQCSREGGRSDEDELRQAVASLAGVVDGDEPVDELAHALQCATNALSAGASPELVAAALLHDIGRTLQARAAFPGLPHEIAGFRWVAPRTSVKVAWLVGAHVPAKVYLVEHDPGYFSTLSEESVHSLRHQRNERSHHPPLEELAAHPWWPEALDLRRWDDAAKVPGAEVASLDEIFDRLRPEFAAP